MKNFIRDTSMWKNIVSGFLATVMGIAVTLGVAQWQQQRETEKNKRDLTIMIIHDLDNTEASIRNQYETLCQRYRKAQYVMDHMDEFDSIPYDTIESWQIILVDFEQSTILFPQMAENIMKGNLDTWSTLSNVRFMQNVEECYSNRQGFNKFVVPKEVVDNIQKKYEEINGIVAEKIEKQIIPKTSESAYRELARMLFATEEMKDYLFNFQWVIKNKGQLMLTIHKCNAENKWLMSVNEEEMKSYIEASSQRAPAERPQVTRQALLGRWHKDVEAEQGVWRKLKNYEIVLKEDNSCVAVVSHDRTESDVDTVITNTLTYYGHWELSGADLTFTFDSVRVRPTKPFEKRFEEGAIERLQKEASEGLSPLIMSDIFIGTDEFSTMCYDEDEKDDKYLLR